MGRLRKAGACRGFTLIEMMLAASVQHVPLLDGEGRVSGVARLKDLLAPEGPPLKALIMAGGFGTRLKELTRHLPKPMLPVGDRPLLEHIITQLRCTGIRHVQLATHYKPEEITKHFGDGSQLDMDISYIREDEPLGTAGVLGLLPPPTEPMLLINGDILTKVDFGAMLQFHREHQAELTAGVRRIEMEVPYGIVEHRDWQVTGLQEKPRQEFQINAGIYLLNPEAIALVPRGRRFDMTDLIQALLAAGRPVACFPIHEYWLDIGQPADYLRAQEYAAESLRPETKKAS